MSTLRLSVSDYDRLVQDVGIGDMSRGETDIQCVQVRHVEGNHECQKDRGITNSMAYGAQRFNAAFTRALQWSIS